MREIIFRGKSVDNDEWGNRIKMTQQAINWLEIEIIGNIYDNPELLSEVQYETIEY